MEQVWATIPKKPQKNWFQHKARVGQKQCSPPLDASRHAAVCPEKGKGVGLVLPFYNAETMTLHLAKFALVAWSEPEVFISYEQGLGPF
ncbi:hypothetical protein [Croceicoccus hydrothermalis]|uniref:hypothetical protein n=1 Tax=Croceicoccus hydrothermalis TaxID=2867964 RepID=UPI001EFC05EF|nr:hypothetical protein [Croceicoccus hydrothermalis]